MHFIRRASARAVSASPSSFLAQSRSINTSSFVLRSKQQSALTQSISKRFYSEEKFNEQRKEGEHSTIGDAVESAKEYASDAAETVKETAGNVAAAAREYAPRGFGGDSRGGRPERRERSEPGRYVKPVPAIYIGNLLFDVSAEDLEREFSKFGKVQRALIAADDRGLSKGFGYVYYETTAEATAAIEARHQTVFEGRNIVVNYQLEPKPRGAVSDPSKTLFIGNIPFEMSDADLNKLFRDIKNVIDVRVAIDRRSGQPRGFAHADFTDIQSATIGKEALQGKELYGRRLRIDYSGAARERRQSPRGSESEGDAASF